MNLEWVVILAVVFSTAKMKFLIKQAKKGFPAPQPQPKSLGITVMFDAEKKNIGAWYINKTAEKDQKHNTK